MTMRDDRWFQIGQHLDKIEAGAAMCDHHAKMLAKRPDFETAAAIELDLCAMALRAALARVEHAQAIYREKEIER